MASSELELLIDLVGGEPPLLPIADEAAGHPINPVIARSWSDHAWYQKTAEQCFAGWIFVSHCVADFPQVDQAIFNPICNVDHHVFLWNSTFLKKEKTQTHLPLVAQALRVVKTVIICGSRSAMQSNWVKAEAHWAIKRENPIVFCNLDGIRPQDIDQNLGQVAAYEEVDFSKNADEGGMKLLSLIRNDRFRPASWRMRRLGELDQFGFSHLVDENNPNRFRKAYLNRWS